jgi:hypothetical protein
MIIVCEDYFMTTTPPIPTIKEVKQRFDDWRSQRGKMGPFPDALWRDAVQLLDNYNANDIMHELRITTTQLEERKKRYTKQSHPEFVDLEVTNNIPEQRIVETKVLTKSPKLETNSQIELRRPDGTTLTIQSLAHDDVQALVTTFIGQPCYS